MGTKMIRRSSREQSSRGAGRTTMMTRACMCDGEEKKKASVAMSDFVDEVGELGCRTLPQSVSSSSNVGDSELEYGCRLTVWRKTIEDISNEL